MQLQHKRTDSPTSSLSSASSILPVPALASADIIVSIDVPPILSLVIGDTTTDFVSSSTSSSASQSASSSRATTLGKSVVTTSMSAVSSDAGNNFLPIPSSINVSGSGGGGGVNLSSGTSGDTDAPKKIVGGRQHMRLTCVPFPGRVAYSMPAVTTRTSQVYGAAAMETVTNYGTVITPLATRSTSSDATANTASDGPNSSSTSQAETNRGKLPRGAIIGIVVAFALVWMGCIVLILRKRQIHLRNHVATTTRGSQKHRDGMFTQHRKPLRHFNFGGRSKRLISLGDDEEGALTHPGCTEREGSTRSGKRLPSIIIHPSVSNFHGRENRDRDRLSISSTSSTGSQYILAEPRQTDVPQPIPDPFSPLIPVTPTESLISVQPRLPEITIHPPTNRRVSAYRRIDRVIPPIPPLPSSPPPLPPIPLVSPSRDPRDPFSDPPSLLTP